MKSILESKPFVVLRIGLWLLTGCALSGATEDNTYLRFEFLNSEDIDLANVALQVFQNLGNGDNLRVEFTANRLGIEYQVPDNFLIGTGERVTENSMGGSLQYGKMLSEKASGRISVGYQDGFTNFRALWIDTYYRQLFGAFSTYEASSPYTGFAEFLYSYEYLPATGIVQLGGSYQYEKTATLWDVDLTEGLFAVDDVVETLNLFGSIETLLSPSSRLRAKLSIRDQENRDLRFIFSADYLHALNEELFVRLHVGHTREGDYFHASSARVELEKSLNESHSLALYSVVYEDNGEREEGVSSVQLTAPEASNYEIGVKYYYEPSSVFRLYCFLGYYKSQYADSEIEYAFSSQLYGDRDWLSAGFSAIIFY